MLILGAISGSCFALAAIYVERLELLIPVAFAIPILTLLFWYPPSLIYTALIFSAVSTTIRDFSVAFGNISLTLSGFVWICIMLAIVVQLVMHLARTGKLVLPPYALWLMPFWVWSVLRWGMTPTGAVGMRDLLWYSLPVLIGLYVPIALKKHQSFKSVDRAFFWGALLVFLVYAFALLTGVAEMTWRGPRGALVGSARGAPLYLLTALSVGVAAWRYGPRKFGGWSLSWLALGTIFVTLARIASALATVVLLARRVHPRHKWRIFIAVATAILLMALAVWYIPALRNRFFFTDSWNVSMGLTGINTAGRNQFWTVTFASAMEQPWIGHGLGAARLVVGQAFGERLGVTEYFPHNEYLHIFHDTGIIGLLLALGGWLGILSQQWQRWKRSVNPLQAKWSMASTLATAALLLSAVTDNSLHYPFMLAPVMIIVGIAHLVHRAYGARVSLPQSYGGTLANGCNSPLMSQDSA